MPPIEFGFEGIGGAVARVGQSVAVRAVIAGWGGRKSTGGSFTGSDRGTARTADRWQTRGTHRARPDRRRGERSGAAQLQPWPRAVRATWGR